MDKYLIAIMSLYYFSIIGLMVYMFIKRRRAVIKKEIRFSYFKTYSGDIPEELKVIQNHFNNQFQIPIVFFIVCILSMQQQNVGPLTLVLATCFVLSRIAHSFIHLTKNVPLRRAISYFVGVIIVGLMLLINLF